MSLNFIFKRHKEEHYDEQSGLRCLWMGNGH